MKITAVLLLAACLQVSAKSFSQITLKEKNAPLTKLFKELKKQSGYDFLFSAAVIKEAGNNTVDLYDVSLQEAIEECLKGKPLTYTIVDKTIIIRKKEEPKITETKVEKETTITISGRISDKDGNPLQGASIVVKDNKKLGTNTDANGVFMLNGLNQDDVIIVSYTGYKEQTIKVGTRTSFVLVLELAENNLQEVIVNKGYYTEKQKYSVGNVGRVTAKEIEKQPVQNPLLALQGRVPGLEITQNNGISGGGVTVRIQGQNSMANGNEPLYIIDGVPYPSTMLSTNVTGGTGNVSNMLGNSGSSSGSDRGSPINYINPSEIESIEILKDADATAIYGSRGANGVILITTKRGTTGKASLDINLQQGWGKVTRRIDMLNRRQYLDMRYEALRHDGIALGNVSPTSASYYDLKVWDTTRYTDWQRELIGGTAQYTNLNVGLSGGTSTVKYRVGTTYNRQTTVFPGSFNDQRLAFNINLNNISLNKKLRFEVTASYLTDKNKLPGADLTKDAMLMAPVAPALYNQDGTLNWAQNSAGVSTWLNPLLYLYNTYENTTTNLISSSAIGYKILPGLEVSSRFGYNNLQTEDFQGVPMKAIRPERRNIQDNNSGSFGQMKTRSWIVEPQVNFDRKIKSSNVNVLLGATIQQNETKVFTINGSGFPSDDLIRYVVAAKTITTSQSFSEYKYAALFGRINYVLNEKYILNITGRRDGSSRFGIENRFHHFGAVGAAWLFTNERLIQKKLPFLTFGKLRASYGTTGNDKINDYQFLSLYDRPSFYGPYQNNVGLVPGGLTNPYLQWEETKKLQIGIDLAFIDNRISIAATYFRNRSSNQLLSANLPLTAGRGTITMNFPALVQNTGIEFSIRSVNFKTNSFEWNTSLNLTVPRNKLVSFPGLENSIYNAQYIVGQPLSVMRAFVYKGVDPGTGKYLFQRADGTLTTSPSSTDQTVFFHSFAKYYGAIQNTLTYKGFQMEVFFQIVNQAKSALGNSSYFYYNGIAPPGFLAGQHGNQLVSVLDRWQKPGDNASIAAYSTNFLFASAGIATASDRKRADLILARLKNVSISWELPSKWKIKSKFSEFKVFAQGQNLATIAKDVTLDPENNSLTNLPPLRVWTFGVKVKL